MQQPDSPTPHTSVFTRLVDAVPAHFVQPSDTDRPTYVVYEGTRCLGTVHGQFDVGGQWHVQTLNERHPHLDDVVRALRRPASWTRDRQRVQRWAHARLKDSRLVVLDVQTTGLQAGWAVQIGATDRDGTVLFDELVNPLAEVTAEATALHGLSASDLAAAPTFDELLPDLTSLLSGRLCLAYNADFDRAVLDRELNRLLPSSQPRTQPPREWHWADAMIPTSVWKGLWSARHSTYRYQPLGGTYDAVTNCRRLLNTMQTMC